MTIDSGDLDAIVRLLGGQMARAEVSRLRIDPDSLLDAHATWMSMPWRRAYTVNIDDLETAAARRLTLFRRVQAH